MNDPVSNRTCAVHSDSQFC